jgi:regulator of protease activity HflC (stomatin/prohibitin superfamily)
MTYIVYSMVAFAVIILAYYVVFILREYQRGVVFFLGRFQSVMGPGLIVLIPGVQQLVRVDLRTRVLDVPTQDVISRDNVSVKVNAVIYFRVFDPEKSIVQVEDFQAATSQLAQTTLRSVLGQHELDEMLSERDKLNSDIQQTLDKQTDAWGIKVANVEIKHVDLNETMVRAIAYQASEKLTDAAKVLSQQPEALTLRYLQTLLDMSTEKTSTVLFPIPIDLLAAFRDHMKRGP